MLVQAYDGLTNRTTQQAFSMLRHRLPPSNDTKRASGAHRTSVPAPHSAAPSVLHDSRVEEIDRVVHVEIVDLMLLLETDSCNETYCIEIIFDMEIAIHLNMSEFRKYTE